MQTFDHLKLIQRQPQEVQRLRACMLRAGHKDINVEHENNDSCCKQEHWDSTVKMVMNGISVNIKAILRPVNDFVRL